MRVTTRHPASRGGVPVILDDGGAVQASGPGLRAAFARLGWDWPTAAARLAVSERTIRGWVYEGRTPEVRCLNVLADALEDLRAGGPNSENVPHLG